MIRVNGENAAANSDQFKGRAAEVGGEIVPSLAAQDDSYVLVLDVRFGQCLPGQGDQIQDFPPLGPFSNGPLIRQAYCVNHPHILLAAS